MEPFDKQRPPQHPGRTLRRYLEERGWSQDELAVITGRRRQTISSIVSGKSSITPDMALAFGTAFGNDPADWLRWAADYELAMTEFDAEGIGRRARIYTIAPVREMQKRGWLPNTDDLGELESALTGFFGCAIDQSTHLPVAARRTVDLSDLNPSERAWCFRARHLATIAPTTAEFSPNRTAAVERKLRQLAAYPKEARKLPRVMMDAGIRFVVVEPLPGAKIDGAAFWLDEVSPVIAVSLRYDRIDAFWFTVMHEFAHIKRGDQHSVDANLLLEGGHGITVSLANDEAENAANVHAADALVPRAELESFIRRVKPFYSADRIVQFAHRVQMHPGIIVGQLQHRGEVGYSALRSFLVKVRSVVVETALTDGWGQTMSPGLG